MKSGNFKQQEPPSGAFLYPPSSSVPLIGYGGGGKGDDGGSSPDEAPDSLHSIAYARVVDLIAEGEIYGPVHGPGGALKDVYLDGTPVQNEDGSMNFGNVQIDFRSGTQTQDPLPGFPASENTIALNVALTSAQPFIRSYTNLQLSAARITLAVGGLSQADTSNGDINGYRVEYAIDLSTDGGAYQQVLSSAFDGKTTQRYARSHRIDFPRATQGWNIRVRRITPNANSSTIQDSTFVDSTSEIIDAKLRYPMSALVGIKVDASQFQSIPTRAYRMRGRILRVPSNYDPEARTYLGTWDGTFKMAWSNNPAWVFYDLVTNDRFGLGDVIPPSWTDKWGLYQIGRYCDELIPDGFGGMEPRATCFVYLQTRADAWKVMQDMASVFRGMSYWASGTISAVADMPSDPVYTFTSANVIDGKFNYVGSGLNTRYTVALVSWIDMTDMGRQKVEYVEDRDAIARYGIRQIEATAFACTSRGQAHRVGKWLLLTSRLETRSVTFSVGLDACRVRPGSIVRVADQHFAGRRIGGRIHEATSTVVTVDANTLVRPGDRLTVNLPSGVSETRTVASGVGTALTADMTTMTVDMTEWSADMEGLPGAVIHITVTVPFSEVPEPESTWTLDSNDLSSQLYRVLSVTRKEGLLADISAIEHNPSKFDNVDFGTRLDFPPITVVPPGVQAPPTNVQISAYSVVAQGVAQQTAVFTWTAAASAIAYEVQWRRNNSDWVPAGRVGTTRLEITGIYAGAYVCRVRAINAIGATSIWATSTETQLDGILAPPPAVTSLTASSIVFGIRLKWGIPPGPTIVERTEIWYGQSPDRSLAIKYGDFAFPQDSTTLMGLAAGVTLYFWARLVDKNGLPGEWYPVGAGVQGTSSSDATAILDYLAGQIAATQLAQSLLQRIDSGGNAAVIAQAIINELAAMYTIKTQLTVGGQPFLAGIGVGVENNQGIITSQILLSAQRVAVLDESSGALKTPFVIQNGQTFINQAFIGDAWINNAMIANASITSAKIQNAQIQNAHIVNANVDRLKIAGQSVTTSAAFDFGYWSGQVWDGNWRNRGSGSITIPENAQLMVVIQNSFDDGFTMSIPTALYGPNKRNFDFRILLNGGDFGMAEVPRQATPVYQYNPAGEGGTDQIDLVSYTVVPVSDWSFSFMCFNVAGPISVTLQYRLRQETSEARSINSRTRMFLLSAYR
ncbi:host specificity protein J [Bordetella flabilis]|uniref:Host specificity protein J n=1 Tax=Bordetella flabilis TaxID=463014 RepID=A0A193GFR7_9BORD|nr:host specificity protein J [Bordetella flabilis]